MGLLRSPGQLADADRRHSEIGDRDGEQQERQDERVGAESFHAEVPRDDRETTVSAIVIVRRPAEPRY